MRGPLCSRKRRMWPEAAAVGKDSRTISEAEAAGQGQGGDHYRMEVELVRVPVASLSESQPGL